MKFMPKWRLRKPADDAKTVYVSEKFGVRSLHIGSDTVQSAGRRARPSAGCPGVATGAVRKNRSA